MIEPSTTIAETKVPGFVDCAAIRSIDGRFGLAFASSTGASLAFATLMVMGC